MNTFLSNYSQFLAKLGYSFSCEENVFLLSKDTYTIEMSIHGDGDTFVVTFIQAEDIVLKDLDYLVYLWSRYAQEEGFRDVKFCFERKENSIFSSELTIMSIKYEFDRKFNIRIDDLSSNQYGGIFPVSSDMANLVDLAITIHSFIDQQQKSHIPHLYHLELHHARLALRINASSFYLFIYCNPGSIDGFTYEDVCEVPDILLTILDKKEKQTRLEALFETSHYLFEEVCDHLQIHSTEMESIFESLLTYYDVDEIELDMWRRLQKPSFCTLSPVPGFSHLRRFTVLEQDVYLDGATRLFYRILPVSDRSRIQELLPTP
mgnify:CR=1 FL=1